MDTELDTYKGGRGNKATFKGLVKLDTLEDAKESYAKIIKAYLKGNISENMGRAASYLLTGYLGYFKVLKDIQIEDRIEAIEQALEAKK